MVEVIEVEEGSIVVVTDTVVVVGVVMVVVVVVVVVVALVSLANTPKVMVCCIGIYVMFLSST